MKLFFAVMLGTFSIGLSTTAWANSDAAPGDAAQLGGQVVATQASPNHDSDHLSHLANQINQDADAEHHPSDQIDLNQVLNLNLPKGMIVRGSKTGLLVGTEF